MKLTTRVETFKIGDQGSINSQIEIIAVHPFKKYHLKHDRAHLEKLITVALGSSGPGQRPRVSYYAVDPDDFRFTLKSGGSTRFVKECQNLAKSVESLLGKEPLTSDKKLIFLAHGLGAALTKHCLANQYEYRETITRKTIGVAFLNSWSNSRNRGAITHFVDGWIRGPPNLLEASEDQLVHSKTNPDNVVDQRRSGQDSARKARREFIDLLIQVENNFREITGTSIDPGPQREFQLVIDGRVCQLQWLGPPTRGKKLRLPAPVIRTPSAEEIDEETKEGLTCIINFLKDTTQLKDHLPPELKVFRYFTEQNDKTKLLMASSVVNDSLHPELAEGYRDINHGDLPARAPGLSVPMQPISQQPGSHQQPPRPLSAERNTSRPANSEGHSDLEKSQMSHGGQTKASPEVGDHPLSQISVETATRRLYHQFVDINAPSRTKEGQHRINPAETLRWLANQAASYVELRELDNADKVYEQSIRLRQALEPGDAHLFVLHLRRAKVWHEMGKYERAKVYLGSIHDAAASVWGSEAMEQVTGSLVRDLEWYQVLTKFRLGDHVEVDELLTPLKDQYLQATVVARIINEPSLPWDENIQIVFRLRRILALNKAKMRHFGEAKEQIDQLHVIVRKLDLFTSQHDAAVQRHNDESSQSSATNEDKQTQKASALLAYTSASVYLILGQYKRALAESRKAVQLLRKISRVDSLDALEARKLEAHLLAYNCKPDEAEVACKESFGSMSRHFGAQHPICLETMNVLVFILRRQARLSEALVTAQGLCRQCEQVLGPGSPQARQSKSQLASIHLSNGNYRDAVSLLEEIAPKSRNEYSSPDRLRYQAELALALFRLGKFRAATLNIQRAIMEQKVLFTRAAVKQGALEKRPTTSFDDELNELMANLRSKPGQQSKYMPHPDLLYSIEVLAHIISETDLALAVKNLELVLDLRKANEGELSGDQHTTEKTRLDVILMKRELGTGEYTYKDAERDLRRLTETLQQLLGPGHPDTAVARSELLLTRAVLGWKPRPLLAELVALKKQQKFEIGRAHPDTLRTRLAVLVVQLLLGDAQAAAMTCRSLLEALRAPEVRNQRLAEALTMEERVAVLYANHGYFAECHGILDEAVTSLDGKLAPQVNELGLDVIVTRVKNVLDAVRSYYKPRQ